MDEIERLPEAGANTDRELWRETPGDYYSAKIHVTAQGSIGIDCGGTVYVKPLREWHALAAVNALPELLAKVKRYESALQAIVDNAAIDTDAPLFRAQAAGHARAALNQEPKP